MARNWDELMEPELTDEVLDIKKELEGGNEPLDSSLSFESAINGTSVQKKDAERSIEKAGGDFIAGGCKPEGDGEITCKFNMGDTVAVGKNNIGESARVKFKDASLETSDVDQARALSAKGKETKRGLAIISDSGTVFCRSKEGKLNCQRFETPENTVKKVVGEKKGITVRNKTTDLKLKESFVSDDVKFPVGGEVMPEAKKEMITVDLSR